MLYAGFYGGPKQDRRDEQTFYKRSEQAAISREGEAKNSSDHI